MNDILGGDQTKLNARWLTLSLVLTCVARWTSVSDGGWRWPLLIPVSVVVFGAMRRLSRQRGPG